MSSTTLRDRVISSAIAAGKFPESRRQHYEQLWANDPTETAVTIAQLAAPTVSPEQAASGQIRVEGTQPIGPAAGGGFARVSAPDAADALGYDPAWLTASERQQIAAGQAGQPAGRIVYEP